MTGSGRGSVSSLIYHYSWRCLRWLVWSFFFSHPTMMRSRTYSMLSARTSETEVSFSHTITTWPFTKRAPKTKGDNSYYLSQVLKYIRNCILSSLICVQTFFVVASNVVANPPPLPPGRGGTLIFVAYVGSGPASAFFRNFKHPQNIWNFSNLPPPPPPKKKKKNITHSVPWP